MTFPPPEQKPRLRALGAPAVRRQTALGAGYTWFVRIARLALPLGALIVIGVVILNLTQDPQKQPINVADLPPGEKTVPGETQMIAAKYQGVDAQGRAYTVSADEARNDSSNTVFLTRPRADIMLEGEKWLAMHAASGTLDNTAAHLRLEGGVTLFHDDGYELNLQDIDIDLKTRDAKTTNPVTAQGPLGVIRAVGMTVDNGGDSVTFTGPAQLTLHGLSEKKLPKGNPG